MLTQEALSTVANNIAALSILMQSNLSLIKQCEQEHKDKNVENLVVIYSEWFFDGWHFYCNTKHTFDVTTEFLIKDKIVAGGTAEFKIDEDKHVKGKVDASLWTNLNCTLTLST